MTLSRVSVAVIGGGPAGIAAAIAASSDGATVLLIEREKRLGGKLIQAIHDGFGFVRSDKALTGPEYAFSDISTLNQTNTVVLLQTTVLDIVSVSSAFQLTLSSRHGISIVEANSIVLATGCRERTPCEAGIYGTRPSGVLTAGLAQYYLNVMGQMPMSRCVVVGSSNLALVTARSLALAGAKILGVYEPKNAPQGYLDYVSRCVFDYDIPFYLEHTVTRAFGNQRIRAVELARTDKSGQPIRGTEKALVCDGLIVSDGFLPQNELALSLGVPLCTRANGPLCDQNRMTMVDGVFAAGNAVSVCDVVDYTSESGEIAGRSAARRIERERRLVEIKASKAFLTFNPHYIDCDLQYGDSIIYFSPASAFTDATVRIFADNNEVFSEKFDSLRPNETVRLEVRLTGSISAQSKLFLTLE